MWNADGITAVLGFLCHGTRNVMHWKPLDRLQCCLGFADTQAMRHIKLHTSQGAQWPLRTPGPRGVLGPRAVLTRSTRDTPQW